MELLKKAKSALNFQDRYSDMEGSEGGYSRKQRKSLEGAKKSGYRLSESQEDRSEYLDTVSSERTRAIATGVAAVGGVVAGAYTGNPALITSSLSMGANYLGGEIAEDAAGNDGLGQQLGVQDAMSLAAPFLSTIGQGTKTKENAGPAPQEAPQNISSIAPPKQIGSGFQGNTGGLMLKQGGKLRYNPRKYDYIKGNTFGL